ncbi:tetratricopeptide repeat protein [Oscillatoria sp. FACHB-1406]|uniref:tetratricopeptide repeat protein n=1 Tax=Oscillatoria sp. FACHB-1406 TaxID=2692846 RepID=UPI0016823D46|nr:tetratricopeptide repeat protein [Oscillatoria sp. FACHB-1406]MBD2578201.1 tetratricopeptide repeat protein [Oscillatoria sp. FACHB-1406]
MKTRSLHRNTASFCLALMSACCYFSAGAGIAMGVETAREEGRSLVAQNDANAEAERLLQEGVRLYQEGSAESLRQAIQVFERARALFRELGNQQREAFALNYIGFIYNALGEKQKALEYFNQALPLYRAVSDRGGEASTLNNIGAVYNALGEKQKALEYYALALPLYRAVSDRGGEATTLHNIGAVYNALGEKQKALEYYALALPLYRAVSDRGGEATTLTGIGAVYFDLGEKQKALEYYALALPLYRAVSDRSGEATTLSNIGAVYNALGEKQKALEYYALALPLDRAVSDRGGEARTLHNIGFLYSDLGEKQKALEYYNQALPLVRAIEDKQGEVYVLGNLAYLHRQQNQLPQALDNINAAIALIEDLRTQIDNTDLRTSYFATVQDFYKFKTDLLMQMGNPQEAFNTNERSRARTLLELLNSARLNLNEGAAPQLLEQEKNLRQQLQAIEVRRAALLSRNPTADTLTALDNQSDTVLGELNQLLAKIRRTNPAYADLKQPQPLTLPQIQQQVLDPETVLLQYSLGKERSTPSGRIPFAPTERRLISRRPRNPRPYRNDITHHYGEGVISLIACESKFLFIIHYSLFIIHYLNPFPDFVFFFVFPFDSFTFATAS